MQSHSREWERTLQCPPDLQRMSDCSSLSALLSPVIPQAATLCNPRLWSFSTKFKLNVIRLPINDERARLSSAVECKVFVLWLSWRLWWRWEEAEMPRSCSSCRSPSDKEGTFAAIVVVVQPPGSKCCWWDGDEVLTCSQFRQDGRLKEWRLLKEIVTL